MATFDYRRKLTGRELAPVIGAAVAAGAVIAYLGRIVVQRTPIPSQRRPGVDATSGTPPVPLERSPSIDRRP